MSTAADLHARWDALTVEELVSQGSMKWTLFPDTIGMWVAEMDFGVAEPVLDAIRDSLHTGALGYLPVQDRARLREATAAFQRENFGWHVAAGDVLLLPDVLSGLSATVTHLTEPGAPIVTFTPGYMPFLTWPQSLGRELHEVPCSPDEDGTYRLNLEGLARTLQATGPDALVILCNPWNPVGRVLTREELTALAEVVEAGGARVFADEIHAPLILDEGAEHVPYASIDERTAAHTTTGVSASKGWNIPGLKCGQLILSNDADRAAMAPLSYRLGDCVGLLGARAAVAAYTEDGGWNAAVRDYLRGNAALLREAVDAGRLPGVRLSPMQGTYIAWLDLRGTRLWADLPEGTDLATALREASGVALTEGTSCGGPGCGFVRMILATPRPVLAEAIDRLSAALS